MHLTFIPTYLLTNDSKLKYFAVEDQEGFNFGFADSYTNLTQYNEDSAVDLITWGALNSSRPYIQFKVSELYYMHLYVDGTVSAIDSKFANAVYVKLVSKQLSYRNFGHNSVRRVQSQHLQH